MLRRNRLLHSLERSCWNTTNHKTEILRGFNMKENLVRNIKSAASCSHSFAFYSCFSLHVSFVLSVLLTEEAVARASNRYHIISNMLLRCSVDHVQSQGALPSIHFRLRLSIYLKCLEVGICGHISNLARE